MLLKRAVQFYLQECSAAGLSANTLNAYRYGLGKLVQTFSRKPVGKLTRANLVQWLADLREEKTRFGGPPSASTLNQCYRSAGSFLVWAVKQGHISGNPLAGVKAPKLDDKVRPHLSAEQLPKFIDALAGGKFAARDQALGLLLIDCGLRLGEVAALRLQDVDTVTKTLKVTRGKGGKGRTVPLSSAALGVLKLWLVVRPARLETLFGLTRHGVRLVIYRASKRAGVKVSPHGLRHTFATLYDGPPDDLQKILGHADVTTTLKIYRHRPDSFILQEHDKRSPLAVIKRSA